jgi:hypothetical protein
MVDAANKVLSSSSDIAPQSCRHRPGPAPCSGHYCASYGASSAFVSDWRHRMLTIACTLSRSLFSPPAHQGAFHQHKSSTQVFLVALAHKQLSRGSVDEQMGGGETGLLIMSGRWHPDTNLIYIPSLHTAPYSKPSNRPLPSTRASPPRAHLGTHSPGCSSESFLPCPLLRLPRIPQHQRRAVRPTLRCSCRGE